MFVSQMHHGVDVSQFQINFIFVFQDNRGTTGQSKSDNQLKPFVNVENILVYKKIMYIKNL